MQGGRFHKAERIEVSGSGANQNKTRRPPPISLFDISCGHLGEMQKRRMSKTPSPRIDFPRMPSPSPVSNYQLSTATMTNHDLIYLAVLAVCEKQDGLCMDVEEERIRLARAIADALAD
jgi:hypothetical protein